MNARPLLAVLALAAAIAAAFIHWNARRDLAQLAVEAQRLDTERIAARRGNTGAERQLAADRKQLDDLLAERARRLAAPPASSSPPTASAGPRPATMTPELRRLQVQAFVSDQRLRYAGFLKHAGLDGTQLQAFDRIVGACQEVFLDPTQDSAARQEARRVRDAELEGLFGAGFEAWQEAARTEPARFKLSQIVQQMFASAGTLTTGQTTELTRVLAENRTPPSGGMPEQYDWDAVIVSARSILSPAQHDAFATAVEFRRASEKMSALTARKS